jgi:hypothetical protein
MENEDVIAVVDAHAAQAAEHPSSWQGLRPGDIDLILGRSRLWLCWPARLRVR